MITRRSLLSGVATCALMLSSAANSTLALLGAGPGAPGAPAPPAALSRVNTATASATTVTVPVHQVGDLILIWAVRGASTTAPSLPSGYTSILTKASTATNPVSARLGYKIATATNDTSGTWTNATQICCHIYRASAGYTAGIGASASAANSTPTNTITYPALTIADSTGVSWAAGFAGVNNTLETIATAPSGMVNQTSVVGASSAAAGHDSNAGLASWSSTNVVTTGTAAKSVTCVVELMLLPGSAATTISQLFSHAGGSANDVVNGYTGNAFKLPAVNSSGAGNCLVLGLTYPSGSAPTSITDNINGTWPAASKTIDNGVTSLASSIYVLPNCLAGLVTITVNFAAVKFGVQYTLSELYGIDATPAAGTTGAYIAAGPSLAAGSFTPTNNDGTGGNLIWSFAAKASRGGNQAGNNPATNPSSIRVKSPFTSLDTANSWNNAVTNFPHASAAYVQTASAAINPTMAVVDDTDEWNVLAVALKINASAGAAPAAGIRVVKVFDDFTPSFPTAATFVLQCSFTGNLRVIAAPEGGLNALTVSDSEGNTWTADGSTAGFWYCPNVGANPNLSIYITGGSGTPTQPWIVYDITGAAVSPYDGVTLLSQTLNGLTSFTASPSPSPTNSNGLVLAVIGLEGPAFSVTAPTGAVFDAPSYTGVVNAFTDWMNGEIAAHYHNVASGAETWTFTMTNSASSITNLGFIAFKA